MIARTYRKERPSADVLLRWAARVGYAACAWAFLFATAHYYWAFGGAWLVGKSGWTSLGSCSRATHGTTGPAGWFSARRSSPRVCLRSRRPPRWMREALTLGVCGVLLLLAAALVASDGPSWAQTPFLLCAAGLALVRARNGTVPRRASRPVSWDSGCPSTASSGSLTLARGGLVVGGGTVIRGDIPVGCSVATRFPQGRIGGHDPMTERSHEKTMGYAVEEVATTVLPDDAALVMIDVQRGFDSAHLGLRNNPEAEENCARLLEGWRRAGLPVFHIRHLSDEPGSPLRAGQPGAAFKNLVRPLVDEDVVEKRVNSAFIGTDLEARLRGRGITALVLAGLTTDHCVSTTARMAGNLGFDTYLAGDAMATFDRAGPDGRRHDAEEVHVLALASLHGEFATVLDAEAVLELLPEPRSRP